MAHERVTMELQARREQARAMGGPRKLAARKAEGLLNARERVDHLLDPGSFLETGLLAAAADKALRDRTPADGKVAGFGQVDGRMVAVVSNDFTVLGASSSKINSKKMSHIKHVATKNGMPIIFFGESTGARMPEIMGAAGIGAGDTRNRYLRMRETPWASAVLGPCYGSSSWYAAMSDFVVMRRGAVMAVASPKLTSLAISEEVDPEALGGWRVHAQTTGLVDQVTDTDEEAVAAIRRFLSYMPSHHGEAPPLAEVPEGSESGAGRLEALLPKARQQVYDVRRVLEAICDLGSVFEMKARFGRAIVTALARLDGRTVGFIANNPLVKGGAIDPDACDKATSFLVLCDSFNIPIVLMVDQPGFLVGIQGEAKRAVGKVINWMNALSLVSVPLLSIIMRKSYGQAVLNMGGAGNADEVAAWTTAEVSFMEPEYGAVIALGAQRDGNPEAYKAAVAAMTRETGAYDLAAAYGAQTVIDPRETRDYLRQMLRAHWMAPAGGVGRHLMRTWPTSF
ncbi:MAG: hypothetical protein J0H91_08190 [Rhodospirillales bacterium]|nr:hypothetical protein [Rhodospirillales bacterium]